MEIIMASEQSQTDMTNPGTPFFDLYRSMLKATSDATRASLEGAERLRRKQLANIEETLATHARVVADLNAAKDLNALIAASRELAGAQYQTLVSYWNGIYESVGENQAEVARLVQSQIEHFNEGFPSTLVAAPAVPMPILAALQPLMEVASTAYALTARATAEATKLAATQLASADAAARQPKKQAQQRSA
jgi:phasin family protein